jgi:AcrR family transcriptional regulator
MDGFERRKEQSKDDIRKAAWELFSQFGVDKVSMTDISRKAGVSHATIYNNFGNKETLVREFVSEAVEQLVTPVQALLATNQNYRQKIAAFVQFIADIMVNGRPSAADGAIFTSSFDLQNDPEIKKIQREAREKMTAMLLGLVDEGKQQGQVDPGLSQEALSIHFGAFMDIFTNPELQHRYHQQPGLIQELGRLMINGLSGKDRLHYSN